MHDMKLKKKKEEIATMPNLPEEILQEIFLRLPTRSLSRFKCVSKSYCALFGSRSFKNLHHELSNIKDNTSVLIFERGLLYTIDYKSVSSLLPLSTSSATTHEFTNRMDYPYLFVSFEIEFLSSCNGLVWVTLAPENHRADKVFYIWNPSTKVYKEIPMAPDVDEWEGIYSEDIGYGFCYDYKNGDYKLVRLVTNEDSQCSDVDVYSLASNSWRRLQGIPYYVYVPRAYHNYYQPRAFPVLLNGALHWLANTFGKDSTVLVRFDIINERFEEVALPEASMPYPEEPLEEDMFAMVVAAMGGCLCLVFHVFNIRVDIWIMQDYGVQESWTKSLSITQESITSSKRLELIWSFKNDEILWEVQWGVFILYEPKSKTCRELELGSDDRMWVSRHYTVDSYSL